MRNKETVHSVKIWPEHHVNVMDGTKTFEIRVNDRNYQKFDKIILNRWCPKRQQYLGPISKHTIGDVYDIGNGRVVFSLLRYDWMPPKRFNGLNFDRVIFDEKFETKSNADC